MSGFDEREKREETQFKMDQEKAFKIRNRRNKLTGLWIAGEMGMDENAANDYAKDVVMADFEEAGDDDVVRKVMADIAAKGLSITEDQLRKRMDEIEADALEQIKNA